MSREWKLYFDDMVNFCEKGMSYTDGMTREQFEASQLNYDATLWNVQLCSGKPQKISPKKSAQKCQKSRGAN